MIVEYTIIDAYEIPVSNFNLPLVKYALIYSRVA